MFSRCYRKHVLRPWSSMLKKYEENNLSIKKKDRVLKIKAFVGFSKPFSRMINVKANLI